MFERLTESFLINVLRNCCIVELEGLLAPAKDFKGLLESLHEVFGAIRQAYPRLHPGKCHRLR